MLKCYFKILKSYNLQQYMKNNGKNNNNIEINLRMYICR